MRVWVSIYMLTNDKALLTFNLIKKVWEISIPFLLKHFTSCSEINSHENIRSKSNSFKSFSCSVARRRST